MNEINIADKLIVEPVWAKLVPAATKMRFKRCHVTGGFWYTDPYRPVFVGFAQCLISDADMSGWHSERSFSDSHIVQCDIRSVISGYFWRCVIAGCQIPELAEIEMNFSGGAGHKTLATREPEARRSVFIDCTFLDSWDEEQDWRPGVTLPEDYYTSNRGRGRRVR